MVSRVWRGNQESKEMTSLGVPCLGTHLPMWLGVYFGNPTQGDGGPARERGLEREKRN